MNILFLTYHFPPQQCPRSVQIAHLNTYLKQALSVHVLTAKVEKNSDPSLLKISNLDNIFYAEKSKLTHFIEQSRGYKVKSALLPDLYFFWVFDFYKAAQKMINDNQIELIVTFGQPMSTHVVGLKLKKKFKHLKWIAHFSDPWVDNPYNKHNFFVKSLNNYFQNQVFKKANKLLFTSPETIALVTEKYDGNVKEKAQYLPHSFNPLFFESTNHQNKKMIIRHIGNFYGDRRPDPFFQAILYLKKLHLLPNNILIEFIGQGVDPFDDSDFRSLTDLIVIKKSVSYFESLTLMLESDLLLLIDAKAPKSVFFPSKLVDYLASMKPIFGITPKGTSDDILNEMGFSTVNSFNPKDIAEKFLQCINTIKENKENNLSLHSNKIKKYSIEVVGEQFKTILDSV